MLTDVPAGARTRNVNPCGARPDASSRCDSKPIVPARNTASTPGRTDGYRTADSTNAPAALVLSVGSNTSRPAGVENANAP